MPPQAITEPSQTYPVRQRKRRRSVPRDIGIHDVDHPGEKRVKRDSSVKRTRLHCIIGNRLGAWAVNHAIRRNRRAESGPDQRTDGGHEDHLTQSISHSLWRNASVVSAYDIKGSFGGS